MVKQIILFARGIFKKVLHWASLFIKNYNQRLYWEMVAARWGEVMPPSRHSLDDIANYRKALSEIGEVDNILVLGSTSELRILASEFAKCVTYVDFSMGMKEATARFVPQSVQRKEKFFSFNWLSLDKYFAEMSFNVILGDLVTRQIGTGLLPQFFLTMHRLLDSPGIFITRA